MKKITLTESQLVSMIHKMVNEAMSDIDNILSSYSEDKIKQMQSNLYKYWKENFTMESIFKKIIERI